MAEKLLNTKKRGVALNIPWERTKQAYFNDYEHANKLSNSEQPDFNVLRELCTGHIYNHHYRASSKRASSAVSSEKMDVWNNFSQWATFGPGARRRDKKMLQIKTSGGTDFAASKAAMGACTGITAIYPLPI